MCARGDAYLNIPQTQDSAKRRLRLLGCLYSQLILRLLPVLLGFSDCARGGIVELTKVFLGRQVLVQRIRWMNGYICGGSVLPCVFENDLRSSWVVLSGHDMSARS